MDKLEEIKQAARELIVANERANKMFGFIGAPTLDRSSILVSPEFFYLMQGVKPSFVGESEYSYKFKVEYQLDELTFFYYATKARLKQWGLI